MKKINELKSALQDAAFITARDERALAVTAVLERAFSNLKYHPILVGGGAVEVYTQGQYASGDLDYILPTTLEIQKIMKTLGFIQGGRLFIHEPFELVIEFPASQLSAEEKFKEIIYQNIPIRIISAEDLVIDRLNAFKWGKSTFDAQNVLFILDKKECDLKLIVKKAKKHAVYDALKALLNLREKIKTEDLNPTQATDLLENLIRKF